MSITDDAVQVFAKSLADLRQTRLQSFTDVRNLQAASRVALQAETARLTARYGPEDPRTLRMKARVGSTAVIARALALATDRLAVGVTVPSQDEAVIEGRVTDNLGRGLPALSVALADAKGSRIRSIVPVATARAGYFALRIPEDTLKRLCKSHPDGVFLVVLDEAGKSAHLVDQPVKPEPGKTVPADIVLPRLVFTPKGKSTSPSMAESRDVKVKKPKRR